jgi:hypothetical protein
MRLVLFQGERHCEPGAWWYLISRTAPGVAKPQRGKVRPYIVNPLARPRQISRDRRCDGVAVNLPGLQAVTVRTRLIRTGLGRPA